MAVNNINNYNKASDGMALPLSITRGNPNPLDDTYLYKTMAAAEEYAANGATAYVGQIITVLNTDVTNGTPQVFVIADTDGTLVEVGGVDADYITNNCVKKTDFLVINCGGALADNEQYEINIVDSDGNEIEALKLSIDESYQITINDSYGNPISPTNFTYVSTSQYINIDNNGVISITYQDGMPLILDDIVVINL